MDIVSEKSRSSSPPISPIKFTTHGAHLCSPPSNLPTWTRASLERAKIVKAIPRDNKERKLVINTVGVVTSPPLASTGTQTEGNVFSADLNNSVLEEYKNALANEQRKLASVEKNFRFVVVHHEDVMKRLRQEVSELKSENKDLNFRLVMTEGQVSSVQSAFSDEYGRLQCVHCKGALSGEKPSSGKTRVGSSSSRSVASKSHQSNTEEGETLLEVKVLLLKEEITKLKTALKDAKQKNSKLTQLMEQQQFKFDVGRGDDSFTHEKVEARVSLHEKHRPGNFGHQPLDRMPRIHPQQYQQQQHYHEVPIRPPVPVSHHTNTSVSEASDVERTQMLGQREQLNGRQEQELSHLNKMFLQQRLAPFDHDTRMDERLPPIAIEATRFDKSFKATRKKEVINLPPVFQPAPPQNRALTDRQKRAKALHVQRQRNNREFTALL